MSEAGNTSKFYYATPGCEGLLQQLQHLLRFGEGLPVVQAGRGAGKTAMAAELTSRLQDVPFLVSLSCGVDQDITEILGAIVEGFELNEDEQTNAGENLAILRQFATQLVTNKQLAVLILDDAHQLDSQSLGAVVSLLQGNNLPGYGLHLVFFASPGLVERVDDLGLIDAPVYDFEIPLFSPSELSSFLKKKFSGGNASFNANLVQQIWSQSLGSPGVALQLSLNAFEEGEGRNETLETLSKIPKGHMLALGVLVAVLLWAAFARESGNDSEVTEREEDIKVTQESDNAIKKEVLKVPVDRDNKSRIENELKVSELDEQRPSETRNDKQEIVKSPNEPKPSENASMPFPGEEKFSEAVKKETAIPPASVQTEITGEKPASTSLAKKPETVPEVDIQTQKPATTPVRQPSQTPPSPSGMTANELFLMDQAPDTYTLQIIAASRKDALIKYMSIQANKNELFLYQGLREGRAWFVVVTGVFTTRQEALAAIKDLPEQQQKGGPWPRQLKDIQHEIAANRSK